MPVLSPVLSLRAPGSGLARFLRQRAALLGGRPAPVDGVTGRTLYSAGLDALARRCAAGEMPR